MKLSIISAVACCLVGCAVATDPASETADVSQTSGMVEKVKGWLDSATSSKPILSTLPAGRYVSGSTAIGVQKDLRQRRGQLFGLVPEPSLQNYVNRIRSDLVRSSGVTDVPGSVYLVAAPELNAVSTADGNIFISISWLASLNSEDQLAALLAHELSHILLHHHTSDVVGRSQKRGVAAYQEGLKLRSQLLAERIDAGDKERLAQAELSIKLMDKGVLPIWGRRQEQDADFLGSDLLVKSGYNLNGMVEMLEVLGAFDETSARSEEMMQTEWEGLVGKDLMTSLKSAGARFVETISDSHPPVTQRIAAVVTYQDKHYAEVDLPRPRTAQFQSAIKPAMPLIGNYRKSYEARVLLLQKKFRDAYPLAKEATVSPTNTAVYPNWVLFLASSGLRNQKEAFDALERAYRNPQDPVNAVYQEYSEALGERRRYRDALAVSELAHQQFDGAPDWLAPRIKWLARLNRKKEAEQLAADCGLQYPDYREACQAALKRPSPARAAAR